MQFHAVPVPSCSNLATWGGGALGISISSNIDGGTDARLTLIFLRKALATEGNRVNLHGMLTVFARIHVNLPTDLIFQSAAGAWILHVFWLKL